MAFIMGVAGACRCDELIKMCVSDIEDKGDVIIVKIPDSKTSKQRLFVITNETMGGVNVLETYREYVALRPEKTCHSRFFVNYFKGRCTTQVVGKNTMAKIPCKIAEYLGLEDAKTYTGHSFRRTSASLLVDAGGDILSLKRHGGWRSTTVAEGYLEESISRKIKTTNQILTGASSSDEVATLNICNSNINNTSEVFNDNTNFVLSSSHNCSVKSSNGITLNNLSNCTININNT